jgi:MscS family membrane protein
MPGTLRLQTEDIGRSRPRSRGTAWPALLLGAVLLVLLLPGTLLLRAGTAHAAPADASSADAPEASADPYPLLPPDTSSPRDTLRSFLASADLLIKQWQTGAIDARGFRNLLNATENLDLRTTLGSEAFRVQIETVLLLKELLDRVELPPADRIPNDREVEAAGLTRWTIPNTRLTMARLQEGPRAGQFLFSAGTAERLEEL